MDVLPLFVAMKGRPVILVGEGQAGEAKRRLLARAGAQVVEGEDQRARFAVVAVAEEARAALLASRLRARGILVNVVDRPALSDFLFPAIVDRSPVTVAVGTGGASAGLAKVVRQHVEALLPADLGGLARALASARAAIRARWPDADARRAALDAALAPGGPLDPLAADGRNEDGAERVTDWLTAAADEAAEPAQAVLVPIALMSPDPDELTLRAARLLARADRVYHRPNISSDILDRARADAWRIPCAAPPAEPPAGLSIDLAYR